LPFLAIARVPESDRSMVQQAELARCHKEEVDSELRQAEAGLARLRGQKTELEGRVVQAILA